MASRVSEYIEAVKNAFDCIMTDTEFSLPTPRLTLAKECVGHLDPEKLDEPAMLAFVHALGTTLVTMVDMCLRNVAESSSSSLIQIRRSRMDSN